MMFVSFFRYYISYIFRARTRQRLLFLALFSLFLSAFALVVLQGVMNGLQSSLVKRSKDVYGAFTLDVSAIGRAEQDLLLENLSDYEIPVFPERETELMVRHQSHISPLILHGVDFDKSLPFLDELPRNGVILGADVSRKLQAYYGGELQLVTPSEMDNLLGDIPRMVTGELSEIIQTDVPEVDLVHGWVRENLVFNLLRDRSYNKFRFSKIESLSQVTEILKKHCSKNVCRLMTWEQKHQSLKWALDLESRMMVFLFCAMSFLVAISITAGLFIFYDKVKNDMASFWIMGMSKKRIVTTSSIFSYALNTLACLSGVVFGVIVLKVLENYSQDFMPDVFVERSLPVEITTQALLVSFCVPAFIALIFSVISIKVIFKEQSSFLHLIRGQGQ